MKFIILLVSLSLAAAGTFLFQPLHPDEGQFAQIAANWHQGIWPYSLIHDNKPPGIYLIYLGLRPLLGEAITGYRLVFLIINLLGASAVYLIGRHDYDVRVGWWGGLTYLGLLYLYQGIFALTEPPVAALTAWCGWLLCSRDKRPRSARRLVYRIT